MAYYWTLCIIMAVLCYFAGQKKKKSNGGLIISILLLFVFYAFREGFTPDYYNYEDTFNFFHGMSQSSLEDNHDVEVGFQYLCTIMPTYRMLLIVFTLLFCVCSYIAFRYYINPRYWWLSIVIFFCYTQFLNGNMAAMRSGIVTCLFFFAAIARLKLKRIVGLAVSLGIMALAFTFHKTALVLVPLLFLPSKPFKKGELYFVYLVAAVFIFVSVFFAREINQVAMLLSIRFFEDDYLNYFDQNIEQGFSLFVLLKLLIKVYILYLTLEAAKIEKDPEKNLFIKLNAAFYLLFLAPAGLGVGMITRFYAYFSFMSLIGTSYALEKMNKSNRTIYIACLLMCCLWQIYDFYLSPTYKIYGMKYDSILF